MEIPWFELIMGVLLVLLFLADRANKKVIDTLKEINEIHENTIETQSRTIEVQRQLIRELEQGPTQSFWTRN